MSLEIYKFCRDFPTVFRNLRQEQACPLCCIAGILRHCSKEDFSTLLRALNQYSKKVYALLPAVTVFETGAAAVVGYA